MSAKDLLKYRCVPPMHLFRIRVKKVGVTCVCKKYTQDFEYIKTDELNMRVKINEKLKIRFSDAD